MVDRIWALPEAFLDDSLNFTVDGPRNFQKVTSKGERRRQTKRLHHTNGEELQRNAKELADIINGSGKRLSSLDSYMQEVLHGSSAPSFWVKQNMSRSILVDKEQAAVAQKQKMDERQLYQQQRMQQHTLNERFEDHPFYNKPQKQEFLQQTLPEPNNPYANCQIFHT